MTTFFTYEEGSLLIRLLIAHCLTDFFMQPDHWVADKKKNTWRSKYLWYHGLVTGIIAWVFVWNLYVWWAILLITGTHILIDTLKLSFGHRTTKVGTEFRLFIIDQILHITVIVVIWLWIIGGWHKMNLLAREILPDYRILLRMFGYLIMAGPVGFVIQFLTRRWSAEINTQDSLKDAGRWIGILERILILTLVYINEFAAIGFLITAKSLLRVIDKPFTPGNEPSLTKPFSARKHTEYVLIGTFLSFAIAIITGLLINRLLEF
ncbi:MAG: DUF3307 domain-containing protein [Chitinophagaceae bacterium]|nr:DUF3307 domain-containing protein [Chitinophagaceae bacterium]